MKRRGGIESVYIVPAIASALQPDFASTAPSGAVIVGSGAIVRRIITSSSRIAVSFSMAGCEAKKAPARKTETAGA